MRPIAAIIVAEFAATGSVSTFLFQTFVAGKIGQWVMGGGAAADAVGPEAVRARAARMAARPNDRRPTRWCM